MKNANIYQQIVEQIHELKVEESRLARLHKHLGAKSLAVRLQFMTALVRLDERAAALDRVLSAQAHTA